MNKIITLTIKIITAIIVLVAYPSMIYVCIVFGQDYNNLIGLWLLILSIALIGFASFYKYKRGKNVFNFLFFTHFMAAIIVLCLEHYDMKYTTRYQVTDSILHYFGWVTSVDDFFEDRVYGFITIIIPLVIMLSITAVFLVFSNKKQNNNNLTYN